ncbi:ATP-binding protein, partial [Streptococcus sp. KCJ4932]|uniref:ATP-binding protein n=1 Tax=Streptococcus sp. KCJ4932 TaxID=2545465 RepID=UPI0014045264
WITIKALDSFIQKEKIELRNLACDSRIMPRIQCLNSEYKNRFKALQYGLTIRTQLNQCVNYIQNGKSIIIHGKAGNGKSGLTENIINWCDENNILHLDLKLDSHIPYGSAQKWGEELGFPTSISHCIDAFSKDNSAVLILDQLDALRWTAKNSKNSISTCLELIREVQNINLERENKISIVLVCRTYDLENDSGIKSIFEQKSDYWYKIKVDEFSEGEVQKILGNKYQKYPNRLKQLLKTPSNLYIWEKFDNEAEYYQISSTYNLVDNWWRDLSEKCQDVLLSEESLNDLKLQLVKLFNDTGKVVFSKRRIEGNEKAIRYLISKGMLIERSNAISFVHQSFLDCFVAEQMVRDYYKNSDIVSIIGQKNKQTPTRRYQLQLFLQILQEDSEGDFLDFGEKLLNNNDIRFNFKYVFLEILGSIQKPSKRVLKYIGTLIQNIIWRKHLCNTVVRGCSSY